MYESPIFLLLAGIITRDGEITPSVKEWKLVDVPELGYFTSDKPFPRGELLVLTDTMIDGYYKHQDVSLPSASLRSSCQRTHQHLTWLTSLQYCN